MYNIIRATIDCAFGYFYVTILHFKNKCIKVRKSANYRLNLKTCLVASCHFVAKHRFTGNETRKHLVPSVTLSRRSFFSRWLNYCQLARSVLRRRRRYFTFKQHSLLRITLREGYNGGSLESLANARAKSCTRYIPCPSFLVLANFRARGATFRALSKGQANG